MCYVREYTIDCNRRRSLWTPYRYVSIQPSKQSKIDNEVVVETTDEIQMEQWHSYSLNTGFYLYS